ncbi:hypothetical protein [Pseudooceanicola atlanticus]|uniref:Uncharacterized protein n=1 Tax=Pseudooceanicola atlanticus TaxID=1461694 RepID=A0A0A0EKG4_9RHOB|nr:hypothetical protein [Pseudooceanicola atlanticus]KGM50658.1 hypothetical protein ATO9_04075 [Pseudooceanicola atlanticus]
MSGADIAAEVLAAVAEATAEVGNGNPLIATITRPGEDDVSNYPVIVPGQPTDYSAVAMINQYSAMDRQGTDITERDVKLMLTVPLADSAGNVTEPQNGDTVVLSDGRTLHVKAVDPLQPGGTVLYWKCQAASGDS